MDWQPITDSPEEWESLRDSELHSLAGVWADQYTQLKESRQVLQFNERLRREWSIETGILERLYTIDRGTTQLLIEQGIDAAIIPHGATNIPVHDLVAVVQAHRAALDGLFDFVNQQQPLSTHYIRQLHQIITQHQDYVEGVDQFGSVVHTRLLRGQWKQTPNNPTRPDGSIHHYCPPLQVSGEMEKLTALFNQQPATIPPEVQAAWLHHRFTQIHPFQDGNGRVARALATLVFLRAGWFPLVINRDQRSAYLDALEAADKGDLKPLVRLFSNNAKQAFAKALTLAEDLPESAALDTVMDMLVDRYQARRQDSARQLAQVNALAEMLAETTQRFFADTLQALQNKFARRAIHPPALRVTASTPANDFYYTRQIVETAKQLGYWADIARQRRWVRLHITDSVGGQTTHVVVSLHHAGRVDGLMAATGFAYFPENRPAASAESAGAEALIGETRRLCETPFYFSYKDSPEPERLIQAYRAWLDAVIAVGLAEALKRL